MDVQKTGIAKFNHRFGKVGLGGVFPQMAQTTTPSPKSAKKFTAPAQPEVVITATPEPKPVRAKTTTNVRTTKSLHAEDVLRVIVAMPGGRSEAGIEARLTKQNFNILPGQLGSLLTSLEDKRRIVLVGQVWRKRN